MKEHLRPLRPVFLALALLAAPLAAQQPPAAAEPPADTGEAADEQTIDQILAGEEEVLAGEGYSYDPAGRRDPFISLLQRTLLKEAPQQRPEGVPGLLIDEIEVKGIFRMQERTLPRCRPRTRTRVI